MTIVGVAPKGFDGTTLGTKPMLYVPISMRGVLESYFKDFKNRRSYWMYLFARLAPGRVDGAGDETASTPSTRRRSTTSRRRCRPA